MEKEGKLTCINVVTRVENPNPLIMMVPKLEIPPFGTLPAILSYGTSNKRCFQHTDNTKNEEHVKLIVHESFENLIRLQVLVLHAGLILPKTVHRDPTLTLCKAACSNRGIGKEDEHNDTP